MDKQRSNKFLYQTYSFYVDAAYMPITLTPRQLIFDCKGNVYLKHTSKIYVDEMLNWFERNNMSVFNISFCDQSKCYITVKDYNE